ncbi:MAG: ATP-binding cassette domain-containing protein [Actinomycetota bacterium]|nr:ATP-binding cassette domain-containing protein [Actinomycetota bacterium]
MRRAHPVAALVRLAWRADRGGMLAMVGATVFDAAAALGGILAVGLLLDAIGENGGVVDGSAWTALAVVAAIFLVQRCLFPFLGPAVESLEHRLTLLVRERVMAPLLRPSTISHLEDPRIADELRQAQQVGSENFSAQQALGAFTEIGGARLAAVGAAVLLSRWHWWAPVVLAAAWLFSRLWYRIQMATLVSSMERSTPALRQAEYVGDLVLGGTAAKETRVFGLAPFLTRRFESRWRMGMADVWRQRRRGRVGTVLNTAIIFGSHMAVLGLLVRAALNNELSIGELFIYLQAALGLSGLGFQPENEYVLRMGAAPLPHVLALDALVAETEAETPAGTRPVRSVPRDSIRLEGVWFGYPRTERPVLEDLDLEIPAGTSLAIVGENGAGKTTLVNLICGFYRPVAGRVTVDGVDLAEFDPAAWQRRIGAVFQDFSRYPVTLRENIVFGGAGRANWEARYRAAEKAGLTDVAEGLPQNWYTTLSREFEGGTELSGGQWQRVALARALFALEAGARILVLDEPTANLDVRAEAALYNRFLELTAGLTTIIVSHRFSTVRRADRIVVVHRGRIVESGNHSQLLALGGRYARMFGLQARHYQPPTPPPYPPRSRHDNGHSRLGSRA